IEHEAPEPLQVLVGQDLGTEQDSLVAVKASGRIPDLVDVAIGPGNTAVDLVILFPKATICLKCNLCRLHIIASSDGRLELRGEIVGDCRQYRQRNGADDIIGLYGELLTGRVLIDYPCAGSSLADLLRNAVVFYRSAKPSRECLRDAIHSADRLQHGRGLLEALAEVELVFPELGFKQFFETERFSQPTLGEPRARWILVTRSRRTFVGVVLRQCTKAANERQQSILVLDRDVLRERILTDGFGEELGHEAAGIVHDLPVGQGPTLERVVAMEIGRAVVVDDHLERDTEVLAVSENSLVVVRNAGGARIEIHVLARIERASLEGVALLDVVAAADRPVATTGTSSALAHRASIAGFRELIGRRHASDAGTKHDDVHPITGAGRQVGRPRVGGRDRQQSHRRHGVVGSRGPASSTDEVQKSTARQRLRQRLPPNEDQASKLAAREAIVPSTA